MTQPLFLGRKQYTYTFFFFKTRNSQEFLACTQYYTPDNSQFISNDAGTFKMKASCIQLLLVNMNLVLPNPFWMTLDVSKFTK